MRALAEFSPPGTSRPLVFAHRGGAALRPENTMVAFEHGLSLGADGVELDVHLSRDGVVVVHHDDTLERTTDAQGPIAALSADELARVDAGYWFTSGTSAPAPGHPFRGRHIGVPRLRSVLERHPHARFIIELKTPEAELAHRAIDDIRAAGALDRVVLGSFHGPALDEARRYAPGIRTGAASEETRWALYRSRVHWPLGRTPYREFQVPERSGSTLIVTPRFIAHAHRAGLPVRIWTVNDRDDIVRLLEWGADSVISDRPDVAVAVVREWASGVRPRV